MSSATGLFRHAKHHTALRTEDIWAEKEFRSLARLEKAGVLAPLPVGFEQNVVVMTFAGAEGVAAPQLSNLGTLNNRIGKEITTAVRRLVIHAGLVHGDLSPYNILLWRDKPYLIDVSQAVLTSHPGRAPAEADMKKVETLFLRRELDPRLLHHIENQLPASVSTSPDV